MPAKQPSYYQKKYFDTQFKHVIGELKEVKAHVKKINGDIVAVQKEQTRVVLAQQQKAPIFKALVKKVNGMERRYIFVSGVATTVGTVIGYLASNIIN